MNIGDRARLLRGKEEGIIRKFIDDKLVELEIEDGFTIPVLRSEIVLISSEEATIFKRQNHLASTTSTQKTNPFKDENLFSDRGIFMAFVQINDQKLSLHLINNTEYILPFSIFQEDGKNVIGLTGGALNSRAEVKIHDVSMQNFEKWGSYIVQIIFFREAHLTLKDPFIRKIKFKANTFFKSKSQAPIIHKEAFLFQLDDQPVKIQAQDIVEKMFGDGKSDDQLISKLGNVPVTPTEIDLHIEKLRPDFTKMSNCDILQMQLETFEKELDTAIFTGNHEITFIHGIGNGVLRNEIHRRLSKNQGIEYFKDAQKEKFGYGATFVKLK